MPRGRKPISKKEIKERFSKKGVLWKTGQYESLKSILEFQCITCDHVWTASAYSTTRASVPCPKCRRTKQSESQKLSKRQVESRIFKRHGYHIKIVGPYTGRGIQHTFECSICATLWKTQPGHVMASSGCPTCEGPKNKEAQRKSAQKNIVPVEEVVERIKKKHGSRIRMLGQYRGITKKHRFKCYTCLHTWKTTPQNITLGGTGCPACANVQRRRKSKWGGVKEVCIAGVNLRLQGFEPQAIEWMLENKNLKIDDILVENSGEVPVIPYKIRKRNKNYYPDMYIPKWNRIIEVKSVYTLGIDPRKPKSWWYVNQKKALACIEQGFKFTLLVMNHPGQRYWLPPKWYLMNRTEVLRQCAFANAELKPSNWKELLRRRNRELGLCT